MGGLGLLPKVTGHLLWSFLLFMEWPALCSGMHACMCVRAHAHGGHWPGRVQVCSPLLLHLLGHPEEHGHDLGGDIFIHTPEGRDLVSSC